MRCNKCFFCTHIGKGIYADYPVKYCKVADQYFMPFVMENGGEIYTVGQHCLAGLKFEEGCKEWEPIHGDWDTYEDDGEYENDYVRWKDYEKWGR